MTDYLMILNALIADAGGKQASVAKHLGVNQSSISRWVNGGKIDADNREKIMGMALDKGIVTGPLSSSPPDRNSIPEIDVIGGLGGVGAVPIESHHDTSRRSGDFRFAR